MESMPLLIEVLLKQNILAQSAPKDINFITSNQSAIAHQEAGTISHFGKLKAVDISGSLQSYKIHLFYVRRIELTPKWVLKSKIQMKSR